jgi:hypothetical protein
MKYGTSFHTLFKPKYWKHNFLYFDKKFIPEKPGFLAGNKKRQSQINVTVSSLM